MKIFYGTTNPAKLEFMRERLAGLDVYVAGLNEADVPLPEIEEACKTPLRNARAKAAAYFEALKTPVFSCDSGLYFEGLPEKLQPGVFVRRPYGARLTDNEMIEYYSGLAEKYGGLTARYKNAVCLITRAGTYESDSEELAGEKFLLVATPHEKIVAGFPLDSLSVDIVSGKYRYDMERGEIDKTGEGFVRFFKDTLKRI